MRAGCGGSSARRRWRVTVAPLTFDVGLKVTPQPVHVDVLLDERLFEVLGLLFEVLLDHLSGELIHLVLVRDDRPFLAVLAAADRDLVDRAGAETREMALFDFQLVGIDVERLGHFGQDEVFVVEINFGHQLTLPTTSARISMRSKTLASGSSLY